MLTELLARIITPMVRMVSNVDIRILGLKVKIKKIEPGWMQGFVLNSMDWFWAPIRILGINCWTMGHLDKRGKSTRFDLKSRYFQAWFGYYLAKSGEHFGLKKEGIEILDYNKLGIADQSNWLRMYMDPIAPAAIDPNTVKFIRKFKIASGHVCHLFSGEYLTDSDTSDLAGNFYINLLSRIIYNLFDGRKDYFDHSAFIPKCNDQTPFRPIRLKGYFGVVPFFKKHAHVVFYGCGTKKNFDKIKKEIRTMIKSAEIEVKE